MKTTQKTRLTLVSANGRAVFVQLPVDDQNKPEPLAWDDFYALLKLKRGDCLCVR